MHALFYDLETSDRHACGQILNYCFTLVDANLTILDERAGTIRLSPLQLPSPDAIMTNRIDVEEHQRTSLHDEFEQLGEISRFVEETRKQVPSALALVGYNSSRFDLPFLRTSLARNGFNPYFGGAVTYRDLLYVSRRAAVDGLVLPRSLDEPSRRSLSLERVTRELGLLHEAQAHEARADVHLTIELAKAFRDRFGLDVLTYDPYEARKFERRDLILESRYPEYDANSPSPDKRSPLALLDANHRSAIWIDLDRYRAGEGRGALQWVTKSTGSLMTSGPIGSPDASLLDAARAAREEFAGITVDTFFPRSVCDIELDIYRLDFTALDLLRRAIHEGEFGALKASENRDLHILFTRFRLHRREPVSSALIDDRAEAIFRAYAHYRYGGKMVLTKAVVEQPEYHPTLEEYRRRLDELAAGADPESARLLAALKRFYDQSPLSRALESIELRIPEEA